MIKLTCPTFEQQIVTIFFMNQNFCEGFILDSNEKQILLLQISDDGEYDGISLFPIKNISYIETNTKHILHLERLLKKRKDMIPMLPKAKTMLLSICQYAKEKQCLVSIGLGNKVESDQYGLILEFSEENIRLNLYTNDCEENGIAMIPLDKIHNIYCDSRVDRTYREEISKRSLEKNKADVIQSSYDEHKLIGIYSDESHTDQFTAGFVIAISSEEFLLARVTPTGGYDGYGVFCDEDLLQVTYDTNYLRRLEALYRMREENHETIVTSDDLFMDLLRFAYTKEKIVHLEIGWSDIEISGVIESMDDSSITLRKIQDDDWNGRVLVEIEDVSDVVCDMEEDFYLQKTLKWL